MKFDPVQHCYKLVSCLLELQKEEENSKTSSDYDNESKINQTPGSYVTEVTPLEESTLIYLSTLERSVKEFIKEEEKDTCNNKIDLDAILGIPEEKIESGIPDYKGVNTYVKLLITLMMKLNQVILYRQKYRCMSLALHDNFISCIDTYKANHLHVLQDPNKKIETKEPTDEYVENLIKRRKYENKMIKIYSNPEQDKVNKRSNFSQYITNILESWLNKHADHPFPTVAEKNDLMKLTKLNLSQINNWFINARRRKLKIRPRKYRKQSEEEEC